VVLSAPARRPSSNRIRGPRPPRSEFVVGVHRQERAGQALAPLPGHPGSGPGSSRPLPGGQASGQHSSRTCVRPGRPAGTTPSSPVTWPSARWPGGDRPCGVHDCLGDEQALGPTWSAWMLSVLPYIGSAPTRGGWKPAMTSATTVELRRAAATSAPQRPVPVPIGTTSLDSTPGSLQAAVLDAYQPPVRIGRLAPAGQVAGSGTEVAGGGAPAACTSN